MSGQRVVLAGGSGFLGRTLARFLAARDYEVVILSRNPLRFELPGRQAHWDGRATSAWAEQLEGAQAVVNLAGRSVNCRYTEANRLAILDSRVEPTRVLGEAIGQCARPPRVWLNSSTATIYQHTFGPAWDESGAIGATREAKDEFSVEVARSWERAFEEGGDRGAGAEAAGGAVEVRGEGGGAGGGGADLRVPAHSGRLKVLGSPTASRCGAPCRS